MTTKPYLRCQSCKDLKPADEFPVKPRNRTGRRGICLTCEPQPTPEPELPPALVERMCTRKRRYKSKSNATAAALRSARRTALIRTYRCPVCKGWHLTRQREWRGAPA